MRIAEYKDGKMIYRDSTPEEEAEFERQQAELPEPEPTPEERLIIMEDAFADLCKEVFRNS